MMKSISITILSLIVLLFCGCDHLKRHFTNDHKIMLRKDTLNTVTMKDTMVIYEGACRGCAYEQSTHFGIEDTAGLVALDHVITSDNNPVNMDGGSVSKDLIIVPKKTGTTTIRMYKFSNEIPGAKDSANFSQYRVEVRN